jgi:hypothetical protein
MLSCRHGGGPFLLIFVSFVVFKKKSYYFNFSHITPLKKKMFPVFVLTRDVASNQAKLLCDRFDANHFDTHMASIDASRAINKKQAEWTRIVKVLNEKSDTQRGVVIVKDTSVTSADKETITRAITAGSENYDLFHLCRWQDECSYNTVRTLPNSSVALVDCPPPDGVQAVYLSPKAVRTILGTEPGSNFKHDNDKSFADEMRDLVSSGYLSSGSTASNLFHYNILMATSPNDRRKVMECRGMFSAPPAATTANADVFVRTQDGSSNMEEDDFPTTPKLAVSSAPLLMSTDDNMQLSAKPQKSGGVKWCWVLIFLVFIFIIGGCIAYYCYYRKETKKQTLQE